MILVDSSVWIDYFNGIDNRETGHLEKTLGSQFVVIAELILAEVLQGFPDDRDFKTARRLFSAMTVHPLLDPRRAVQVAENHRTLRRKGCTVRTRADTIIATFCIDQGLPPLFSDRDFAPFVKHLGLQSALDMPAR